MIKSSICDCALKLFEKPMMPSELSKKMSISLTHGSKIIRELNSKKIRNEIIKD